MTALYRPPDMAKPSELGGGEGFGRSTAGTDRKVTLSAIAWQVGLPSGLIARVRIFRQSNPTKQLPSDIQLACGRCWIGRSMWERSS
jgi:hypothetical protein